MGNNITEIKRTMEAKFKDLFEAILEKDVRIQELEEKNESYEGKISKFESSKMAGVDSTEFNQILTINSALKSNIKSWNAKISELEGSNKDLTLKSKC